MSHDTVRLTETYLALWKLVDIHFPGHRWLEISPESPDALRREIQDILEGDLSWTHDRALMRSEITSILELVNRYEKSEAWLADARAVREELQGKALEAAASLSTAHESNALLRLVQRPSVSREFFVGESLVGDGNEVAHVDLIIGSKQGHAGGAFTRALAQNADGFTTLLAIVAPNLPAKPDTLLFNKVTIKNAKQATQVFGPAQAAVARAVVDSVASGTIPRDKVDEYCVLVGVFIHWDAHDDAKIFKYNYEATKVAIARALRGLPRLEEVLERSDLATHPFAAGADRWG